MKKYIAVLIFSFSFCKILQAQLGGILKDKLTNAAKQGVQNSTEKAADKVIDKALSKKNKKTSASNNDGSISKPSSSQPTSIKAYSKYDFVSGDKILAYDDFTNTAVGDFPAQWNTNASAEIMTVDNHDGHWLNVSKEGYYLPKFIKTLTDNFTIEYDVLFLPPDKNTGPNTAALSSQFVSLSNAKQPFDNWSTKSFFSLDPYMNNVYIGSVTKAGEKLLDNQFNVKGLQRNNSFMYHVAIWRQKERLRVYLNEAKVVDAPSLMMEGIKYNGFRFQTSLNNDGSTWLISNFKLATGLPDTRNKLITTGKFVTTGILFATNSATIQATSFGTLKEIAQTLKENEAVRIKIIGHTDTDGDAANNLDLSIKRAEAVKNILAKEFGINKDRMETDGKGQTQPITNNNSSDGKAQNRRVEFIKL